MPWLVWFEEKLVEMPFEGNWIVPDLEGRFPNGVMLGMDESRFKDGFARHAVWTRGTGEYATLAYCGGELTIMRHATLERAVEAKRTIDASGCGGGCVKVHAIIEIDPRNSRRAKEQENIRKYQEQRK
jgi:hypothetical protein